MAYKSQRQSMIMQPTNVLFQFLQTRAPCEVWLYEEDAMRITGVVVGFDEYMNTVLKDAKELHFDRGVTRHLGTILLKGDTIGLLHDIQNPGSSD